jgi:cytoskeletal protein RodZ
MQIFLDLDLRLAEKNVDWRCLYLETNQMEKFDQPELHPRGFPLWVNILLVSALILTPLVVVALFQAWQDKQAAEQAAAAQPAATQQAVPQQAAPRSDSTDLVSPANPGTPETKDSEALPPSDAQEKTDSAH